MPPEENKFRPDLTKNPGSPPKGPAEPPPMANTPIPAIPAGPPTPPRAPGQFDFMLKDPKAPSDKLGFLSNLSKPVRFVLYAGVAVFLIFVLSSVIFHKSNNFPQVVDLMAQEQEILRVSNAYQKDFGDQANLNVTVTTVLTLTNQQALLNQYLATNKFKYKPAQLLAHYSKSTDTNFQSAIRNNNFDQTFMSYLNSSLQKYQASISDTYKTSGANLKKILNNDFKSNKVLLASPQFSQS